MQPSFTLLVILCILSINASAQDTNYLKVHFLYGSKPLKKYKDTEQKWFGGIMGGHVGIEGDSNKILNFLPNGKFHWIAQKNDKHSTFAEHNSDNFYAILGSNGDSVKKAIVYIPITPQQKQQFDSIATEYLREPPYDYALLGMRCGAAAYEILGQLHIVQPYSEFATSKKIFYPQKLRKRLLIKAEENGWLIVKQEGSPRRKWEQD